MTLRIYGLFEQSLVVLWSLFGLSLLDLGVQLFADTLAQRPFFFHPQYIDRTLTPGRHSGPSFHHSLDVSVGVLPHPVNSTLFDCVHITVSLSSYHISHDALEKLRA
jgi:hypothetical protein